MDLLNNINSQMNGILEALRPTQSVEGLNAFETELVNKQIEQDSIDWGEFDKRDQIIFSSSER